MRSTCLLLLCLVGLGSAKESNRFEISSIGRQNPRKGQTEPWIETFSLNRRPNTNMKPLTSKDEIPERLISKNVFAASMAILAGMADVFSFRMSSSYANMMTGNNIKLVTALGELRIQEALHYASLVLCYGLGNTIYKTIVHFHHEQSKPHERARAITTPMIVALFVLSDYLFYTKGIGTEWVGNVIPLALGFGILNAATIDALGGTITFAMTGHISKVAQGISDWFFHPEPRKRRFRSATKTSARVIGFFALGIIVGTWLATSGSRSVIMEASGMTLPSFLVDDINLPVFTIVGVLSAILIQLFDQPFPVPLWETVTFVRDAVRPGRKRKTKEKEKEKVDLTVNLFSPATWAL